MFAVVSWHGRSLLIRIEELAWFDDICPMIGMPQQPDLPMHVSPPNHLRKTGEWYHKCSKIIHNAQRELASWANWILGCIVCKKLTKIFNLGKNIHALCDLQRSSRSNERNNPCKEIPHLFNLLKLFGKLTVGCWGRFQC
jgi:hypothetical protein